MLTLLILVAISSALIYAWLSYHYSYWRRLGIEEEPPKFIFGNLWGVGFTKHVIDLNQEIYRKFKDRVRFCGSFAFFSKALCILDLDLINRILISDFNSFVDRGLFHNVRDDPLTENLVFLDGDRWRWLRQHLSPVFSSGKMKHMFPTMVKVGEQLTLTAEQMLGDIEVKELSARFSTDVIVSCALGLESNSLSNPESEFLRMAHSVVENPNHNLLIQLFMFCQPEMARRLRLRHFRPEVSKFFLSTVRETLEYRKKHGINRNDLMQLLINISGQLNDDDEVTLTVEQITAQAIVFFLGGFDTSSTAMSYCLYELALNPDIQLKLRTEIQTVLQRYDNQITYESIQEMPYLTQAVSETLRKYPPPPHLIRCATKPYRIPGSNVVLEQGTRVIIPVHSIHHDPAIYPQPDRFDPARFDPEAIKARHPCAYLPFGNGPRNCVGERFGLMQTKIGLIALLRYYKFSVNEQTQIPLKLNKRSFLIIPESGVHMKMKRLSDD